jgi:peptidoglycan/xylan/chitin deacetylase (PgdA/CDA1 family)
VTADPPSTPDLDFHLFVRLDRFITLNMVQPFRRMFALNSQLPTFNAPIPILMYHSISEDREPGVHPYYKTCTSLATFRQHMQFLSEHGYRAITISQAVKLMSEPATRKGTSFSSLPSVKQVVLTFDDGFRNFYTEAFPVLQQYGFTATMFLATAFIGNAPRLFCPQDSSPSTNSSQRSSSHVCLTWSEVKELNASGIEIGSHTVNHPRLVDLPWSDVEMELRDSKNAIEDRLGTATTSFCYPFAFPQTEAAFTRPFRQTLRSCGYRSCATTALGRLQEGGDPFALKRLPVNSCDDPRFLQAKLAGGYDWLAWPQGISKQCRRWRAPHRRDHSLPPGLKTAAKA